MLAILICSLVLNVFIVIYLLTIQKQLTHDVLEIQKYFSEWMGRQDLLLKHINDRTDNLQSNLVILAKVIKIFEDETQILHKKNEQNAIKQRFTNRQVR